MEIEKLLKLETTVEDKIEMIISNNFDIMYKGKAAVTIDKWDKLRMEILALHKSEVDKLNGDNIIVVWLKKVKKHINNFSLITFWPS